MLLVPVMQYQQQRSLYGCHGCSWGQWRQLLLRKLIGRRLPGMLVVDRGTNPLRRPTLSAHAVEGKLRRCVLLETRPASPTAAAAGRVLPGSPGHDATERPGGRWTWGRGDTWPGASLGVQVQVIGVEPEAGDTITPLTAGPGRPPRTLSTPG